MAISYPLSLPTSIGIANITLTANNAVAISESPFTYQQQIVAHPGQRWSATVSVPPLRREYVEPWVAMLLSLKGQVGTFLLGDPNGATPRGSALSFRKNLLSYTEQFDNAGWSKSRTTVTPNVAIAPDGLTTADKLVETVDNGTHAILEAISSPAETTYTWSVYLKAAGRNFARVRLGDDDPVSSFIEDAIINLSTGELVSTGPEISVTSADNGWWRISVTGTTKPATTAVTTQVLIYLDETTSVYTGDGTSGIFIWGAQLELGSTATDYQPIADSYGPFVKGAGQTGGTLLVDGTSPDEAGYLLAGDYIQLGSGATATLHKVLQDVDTNEAGEATLEIWPNIRTAPDDNAAVTLTNTVGRFRLATNQQSWSINESSAYGLSFDCVEAL